MGKSIKKNAIYNTIKQCCNILFPLVSYPYIARTLMPEGFGRYSFADSIVSIAMTIAAMGIPTYALREGAKIRDKKDELYQFSKEIFSINLLSMVGVYLLLVVLMCVNPTLKGERILIAILSVNILTSTLARDWATLIYEDFAYMTIRYVSFQLIALLMLFVFVHSPEDCVIYTLIMLLANSGGYIVSAFYSCKYIKQGITFKIDWKKHIKPVAYLLGVALSIHIYVRSDIAMLGFFKSNEEVGIYSLTSKIYLIVKALLNAIVASAIPRLSYLFGNEQSDNYQESLRKIRDAITVVVFPSVVGLFFMCEEILQLMGGNSFITGCVPLRILCVALMISVFGCFYANAVLVVKGKDLIYFYATFGAALVNVGLNILLIPSLGMNGAAITTVIAELIVLVIAMLANREQKLKINIGLIVDVLIGCGTIALICVMTKVYIASGLIRLIVSVALSVVAYATIQWLFFRRRTLVH